MKIAEPCTMSFHVELKNQVGYFYFYFKLKLIITFFLVVNGNCVGNINSTRTGIDWLSFDVVLRRSKLFADGLLQLGLEPKSTFGIYSINSSEYTIAEYSCYRHSIIVIPIYETLGSNVCGFISQQGIVF